MRLRRGVPEDLAFILPLEAKYRELGFLGGDPPEVHQRRISDPDAQYWIVESDDRPAGYVILRGLALPSGSIELKRIAIAEPERGLGRRVLAAIFQEAFDKLGAHRLWLDVFDRNTARAASLPVGRICRGRRAARVRQVRRPVPFLDPDVDARIGVPGEALIALDRGLHAIRPYAQAVFVRIRCCSLCC